MAFNLKRLGSTEPERSIIIVVSPLLAFMKDQEQVATYSDKGVALLVRSHPKSELEWG